MLFINLIEVVFPVPGLQLRRNRLRFGDEGGTMSFEWDSVLTMVGNS
ncbi:hypothetical protein HanIR_Chr12g0577791 [Helianthus annuus]|nr:hypothetical protein HanIR_Chr12g0577791 [Helianthus annuus]